MKYTFKCSNFNYKLIFFNSSFNKMKKILLISFIFLIILLVIIITMFSKSKYQDTRMNAPSPSPSPSQQPLNGSFTNTILFSEFCYYDSTTNTFGKDQQKIIDEIYEKQKNNEFGSSRYALLFLPGKYYLNIKVGYYTSVIGLGKRPNNVQIYGNVEVENQGPDAFPGALNNFWRSCENMSIIPTSTMMFWRVSQASPLRSVFVQGNLYLSETPGYASGGFMADSLITGNVNGEIQQQWMSRNNQFTNFSGVSWNLVSVGDRGKIEGNTDCNRAASQSSELTNIVDKTPIIASKPYLFWDSTYGKYYVNVPEIQNNIEGVLIWSNGFSLPFDTFYVVKKSDSAAIVNKYLLEGSNLFFSPDIYTYDTPLYIVNPQTVVLGIGFATIVGQLNVSNKALGVRIAGLMIQAGKTHYDSLINIGSSPYTTQSTASTILSDIFIRVGGDDDDVSCTTMLTVNQNNTIIDNCWAWRADHSKFAGIGESCKSPENPTGMVTCGLGPSKATVDHCLIVNGDYCTIYGLAAEHAQKELVIWNGNFGKLFFSQSEMAYDVPSDWNYPAIRITGNNFYGIGLGVYTYFAKKWNTGSGPSISSAIVMPVDNDSNNFIQSSFTSFLNPVLGNGIVNRVLNNQGGSSSNKNPDSPVWVCMNKSL